MRSATDLVYVFSNLRLVKQRTAVDYEGTDDHDGEKSEDLGYQSDLWPGVGVKYGVADSGVFSQIQNVRTCYQCKTQPFSLSNF